MTKLGRSPLGKSIVVANHTEYIDKDFRFLRSIRLSSDHLQQIRHYKTAVRTAGGFGMGR